MRSRYSAYTLGLEDYLLKTWHPDTRPDSLDLASENSTKWLGLEIKRTENINQNRATVEFVARYKIGGAQAKRLHEVSQFIFSDAWYYLAGEHL